MSSNEEKCIDLYSMIVEPDYHCMAKHWLGGYIKKEDLIERLHNINLEIVFEPDAPLKPIFKLLKELGANV